MLGGGLGQRSTSWKSRQSRFLKMNIFKAQAFVSGLKSFKLYKYSYSQDTHTHKLFNSSIMRGVNIRFQRGTIKGSIFNVLNDVVHLRCGARGDAR